MNKNLNQQGFTLTELVVVLAIFSLIFSAVAAVFVSVVQRQKDALGEQEFSNQASYAMEKISRAIRMAIKDEGGECSGANGVYLLTHYNGEEGFYEGMKFINSEGECQEFFLADGKIKEIKGAEAEREILSGSFLIESARFAVNGDKALGGAVASATEQPRISIVLKIKMITGGVWLEKTVQTTISQVNINES